MSASETLNYNAAATAIPRLNVGSGPNHLRAGWINMDIHPFTGVDVARDATLPFDDLGPLSHVFSEHFIEHLTLDGAIRFLRNSLTSLHPGGRMRLSTPCLERTIARSSANRTLPMGASWT